jgi:hypothetical protein
MKTASTLVVPEIAPEPGVNGTSETSSRGSSNVFRQAPVLVPAGALALGWWSLGAARRPHDVGGFGLIGILPVGAWVALGVLIASFAVSAVRGRFTGARAAVHVLALVVLLHGAPALLYQHPRFSTAWLHAGFIEYIQRTGDLLPYVDARFNWPGFFTGAALLGKLAGLDDPVSLLAWFPVLVNLAYALPLMVIGRMAVKDARVRWIGLWCFYIASWVGQDYLSPQAVNLFLYLCVLAVVLTYFRPPLTTALKKKSSRRWVRFWSALWREEVPAAPTTKGQRLGLFAAVVGMGVASVVSHQLTPVFLVVALGALGLFRRSTLRGLPLLLGVVMLAFLSYATVPFWSGHLKDIFGGVGKVGSSVGANVGDRVQGNADHQFVVQVRMLVTVILWLLAGAGLLRRLKRTGIEPALILLATVPVVVVGMQSYGGEAMLRVYAFTLPFMALALAIGFAPQPWVVRRVVAGALVLGVLSAALALGFYVARFGNERFEFMRPTEVAAMRWVYDHAPPGSIIEAYDDVLPWQFRDVEAHQHLLLTNIGMKRAVDISYVARRMRANQAGGFVVLTTGQEAAGEENFGLPVGWMRALRDEMVASGNFVVVYENRDAWVLQVTPPVPLVEVIPAEPTAEMIPAAPPPVVVPSAPAPEIVPSAPAPEIVPSAPAPEIVPVTPAPPTEPAPETTPPPSQKVQP